MIHHSFDNLNGFGAYRPFVSDSSHYLVNYILIQSDGVQHIKRFTPCCLRQKTIRTALADPGVPSPEALAHSRLTVHIE